MNTPRSYASAPRRPVARPPLRPPPAARVPAPAAVPIQPALLQDARLAGRGHGVLRQTLVHQLQQTHGNRTLQRMLRSAPPAPARRTGAAPGAPVPIQRIRIAKSAAGRYVDAERGGPKDEIIETRLLPPGEKEKLVAALKEGVGRNEKLLARIEQEWNAVEKETGIEDLDDLYKVGAQLEEIEKRKEALEKGQSAKVGSKDAPSKAAALSDEDTLKLQELGIILLNANAVLSTMKAKEDAEKAYLYHQLIGSYLSKLTALSGAALKKAQVAADQEIDLTVTAQEIAAYRADMQVMNVWGGLAEADHIARNVLRFTCDIFSLRNGHYQKVQTIGTGPRHGTLNLLFLGDHYVVVQNAVDGALDLPINRIVATEADGNCLFEALQLIETNGTKFNANIRAFYIRWLRQMVTNPPVASPQNPSPGMTDQQIETSIMEMLLSGHTIGAGPQMKQLMQVRRVDEERLTTILSQSDVPDFNKPYYEKMIKTYLDARKLDPGSVETLKALKTLNKEFSSFKKADNVVEMPGTKGPIEQPKLKEEREKLEQQLREAALLMEGVSSAPSEHHKEQVIIKYKGEEYVLDRLGQLVPRFTTRNISDINEDEWDEHAEIYPTNISPHSGASEKQQARGTGENVMKDPGAEMEHVQGHKPSDFLSATALVSGALNPQGKAFTNKKGKKSMQVSIDLAYLAPTAIRALYTDRAIRYWLLASFKGDKDKILRVVRDKEASKVAKTLAEKYKDLSGKEWQALLDVIRTQEVLISSAIPGAALKKK